MSPVLSKHIPSASNSNIIVCIQNDFLTPYSTVYTEIVLGISHTSHVRVLMRAGSITAPVPLIEWLPRFQLLLNRWCLDQVNNFLANGPSITLSRHCLTEQGLPIVINPGLGWYFEHHQFLRNVVVSGCTTSWEGSAIGVPSTRLYKF